MAGYSSDVSGACAAAAPGQRGIYFGIIGFGIAVLILGIVLRSARKPAPVTPGPPVSIAEELNRLLALRNQGVLIDEEFEDQKRTVLSGVR